MAEPPEAEPPQEERQQVNPQVLKCIIEHTFLPPKLPGGSDKAPSYETDLVELFQRSLESLKSQVSSEDASLLDTALNTLCASKNCHDEKGLINVDNFKPAVEALISATDPQYIIPLHVTQQNAAVLISRNSDGVLFEVFELAPDGKTVAKTQGRIRRHFPDAAVILTTDAIGEDGLLEHLGAMLGDMSRNSIAKMQSSLGNGSNNQHHDTAHPGMVTELVFALLRNRGHAVQAVGIWKNTRDELLLSDGYKTPWRRSPGWLNLRVALQLTMSRKESESHISLYKKVMVYFLASILKEALLLNTSSEYIDAMVAKISRRLLKLGEAPHEPWMSDVAETMRGARSLLTKRWGDIIAGDQVSLEPVTVEASSVLQDTQMSIPGVDQYLELIQNGGDKPSSVNFSPPSNIATLHKERLPELQAISTTGKGQIMRLAQFESWVETCLDYWIYSNMDERGTCESLLELMQGYHKIALSSYAKNPEAISVMHITILELWVACDRAALRSDPLLSEYNHDIPTNVLRVLLLPTKKLMKRLEKVEIHLYQREHNASIKVSIVDTSSFGHPQSYPVRFFNQNSHLQDRKAEIEAYAGEQQSSKRDELKQSQKDVIAQQRETRNLKCEQISQTKGKKARHNPNCPRCKKEKELKDLSIQPYEWPLPLDENHAKAVVFETSPPETFSAFRDALVFLRCNVLMMEPVKRDIWKLATTLLTYPGLKGFINQPVRPQRVVLVSASSSSAVSSKRKDILNLNARTIILTNEQTWSNPIAQMASIQLETIKKEAVKQECIKMEDKEEPSLEQITFQASTSRWRRQIHQILEDANFVIPLLQNLQKSLDRVRGNWDSCIAVGVFGSVVSRLLTLGPSDTREQTLEFLTLCQTVCLGWLGLLRGKMDTENSLHDRACLIRKARDIALIGMSLFYLDQELLGVLIGQEKSRKALLTFAIMVKETELGTAEDDILMRTLAWRAKQVMRLAHPILQAHIVRYQSRCLDHAIRRGWDAFKPAGDGGHWKETKEDSSWITAQYQHTDSDRSSTVHFDLLTGELLVDGAPLTGLPREYEQCNAYTLLFGQTRVQILPSSEAGTRFVAKSTLEGQTIHFGALHSSNLPIRTRKDSATYELLPQKIFRSILPIRFSRNFVHWYNVKDDCVEFRPKNEPWKLLTSGWRLIRVSKPRNLWRLRQQDSIYLIGPKSPSAVRFQAIFEPLERLEGLHFLWDDKRRILDIDIPRLKLSFSVAGGSNTINSHQYRGMRVDTHQGIGCLIGLESKLTLCSHDQNDRMVLIPEGTVTWESWELDEGRNSHVKVLISRDARKIQSYRLQSHLGRLKSSGELQNKLLLVYLHALTSYSQPDPFTNQTGTEEALNILRSGSVRSTPTLSKQNGVMLELIAQISPSRHLGSNQMQAIKWDSVLTFQAQHSGFVREIQQVFKDAQRRSFLYTGSALIPELDHADVELLDRDSIRSSAFVSHGYGAELFHTDGDEEYEGRGRDQTSGRCQLVSGLVQCAVLSLSKTLPQKFPLGATGIDAFSKLIKAGGTISSFKTSTSKPLPEIRYSSADWMKPEEDIFANFWWALHWYLTENNAEGLDFKRTAWISSMAYVSADETHSIWLAIFAMMTTPKYLRSYIPKSIGDVEPHRGGVIQRNVIMDIILKSRRVKLLHPDKAPAKEPNETSMAYHQRCTDDFKSKQDDYAEAYTAYIMDLQPDQPHHIKTDSLRDLNEYIDAQNAEKEIRMEFKVWNNNVLLNKYIEDLCKKLQDLKVIASPLPPYAPERSIYADRDTTRSISWNNLLESSKPPSMEHVANEQNLSAMLRGGDVLMDRGLESVIKKLNDSAASPYRHDYVAGLRESCNRLNDDKTYEIALEQDELLQILQMHLNQRQADHDVMLQQLKLSLEAVRERQNSDMSELSPRQLAFSLGYSPRISSRTILELFHRDRWRELNDSWRRVFIAYGISFTLLQQAHRLLCKAVSGETHELIKELQNCGPYAWEPSPEQLLLEIENDFRVRGKQNEIAYRMQRPPDNSNAVMQLNMGEGKSSVIIPLVAMSIADGLSLARVIVPKAQYKQMFDTLDSKLGNLIGRRVYQLPFSRDLRLGDEQLTYIEQMLRECLEGGGVLLVQPEHPLSSQLMTIESLLREPSDDGAIDLDVEDKEPRADVKQQETQTGIRLSKIQQLFTACARDILDESDQVFSTKFELSYTVGSQQPIEFSPERWLIIQHVLELVAKFSVQVKAEEPQAIVMDSVSHRFPSIRILKQEAWNRLKTLISQHIFDNGIFGFLAGENNNRDAFITYISKEDIDEDEIFAVEGGKSWTKVSCTLYLLRGLLACGVLQSALEKRCRVNYGLDSSRRPSTALAVPYHAKDCPAPRSEYSHPDVVITLTCLSYYYDGLKDTDMALAINKLGMSDQAEAEYQSWVATAPKLASEYHHLEGVNWDDAGQRGDILEHFRFSKGTIDFFLARIVFPKEMRGFPRKLSAHGWDLGCQKMLPLTGFSGTNDTRYLLPHTVTQLDIPDQQHTNALNLEKILSPENHVCLLTKLGIQGVPRAVDIIATVVAMDPEARVILDVGAQIIELKNREVASTWLSRVGSEQVQAAVFFDENGHLAVMDRQGDTVLLKNSPFATQLDRCLIFLDEENTRGTDLRLPSWYRAAVTLSASVTKDRLVQACGRMRKLGVGQSLVFIVNEEIEAKIGSLTEDEAEPTVADIICWAVHETWADTERSIPVWAAQGRRFARLHQLWTEADGDLSTLPRNLLEQFSERDARSLEDYYRPITDRQKTEDQESKDLSIQKINEHYRSFEVQDYNHDRFDAEQEHEQESEREQQLAPEIEQQTSTERPKPAKPRAHSIHKDVLYFVKNGLLSKKSRAFKWAFQAFKCKELRNFIPQPGDSYPGGLMVTVDFAVSVESDARYGSSDSYQKPVEWVLIGGPENDGTRHMIVISAFEANELWNEIKTSPFVSLHIYAPRQNKSLAPLDSLQLYTLTGRLVNGVVPKEYLIELNIFAGQLYFKGCMESLDVFEFLGMAPPNMTEAPPGAEIGPDRFINITNPEEYKGFRSRFTQSPVRAIKRLMTTIRRESGAIDKTHMGMLLDGHVLSVDDLEPSKKRSIEEISRE